MESMNHEESRIQHEIVMALRSLGVFCFSIPNEGAGRDPARQAQLAAMGLTSGVSDLEAWCPDGSTLYLEVKTKRGRQSEAQMAFERKCVSSGREYHVVRSPEEALAICMEHCEKRSSSEFYKA